MLLLKNIVKDYEVANQKVHALKGVSINFRKSEFVSILGPSGCGKTTLLNIIGGLDKYTSGDLVINGKSTKDYKDKDWDIYRNHRIGFIFQSYNLIPHQTVLQNVELALTIAGVSKEERIKKSKNALDRVGLKGQYNKKPNQLSGGQCQRVAIARALVNDPEILLADEPTGALDSVTSVQIMDLIKEISKERLVIMVTHNGELAEQYSTRIVRLLDGELLSDSSPYSDEEEQNERIVDKNKTQLPLKKQVEKAKMSYFTAFKLSLKNLFSKRGRTIMVGFAGSIGIIGIALVLALSAGIKNYVISMQDDMLSGNPITISEETYDLKAMTNMMDSATKKEIVKQPNKVYINSMLKYLAETSSSMKSMLIKNDISNDYVEYVKNMPNEYYSDIIFNYGIDFTNNIYTEYKNKSTDEAYNLSISALTTKYTAILEQTDFKETAPFVTSIVPSFEQAPSNQDYINSQYDVYGKVATKKNEIMLVLDKNDQLLDVLLARLGYYTEEEFLNLVYEVSNEEDKEAYFKENKKVNYFDYNTLLSHKFTYYTNNQIYNYNFTQTPHPTIPSMLVTEKYYDYLCVCDKDGLELEVVGILSPKDSISYGCMTSGIYYTKELTEYALQKNIEEKSQENSILSFVENLDENTLKSLVMTFNSVVAVYDFSYSYLGQTYTEKGGVSLLNSGSLLSTMLGSEMDIPAIKQGVIRKLAGNDLANYISIYPLSFDDKNLVTDYLDEWNGEGDISVKDKTISFADRNDVTYTDTLELVINLINNMIDMVSYALIAFTSISLVVSTVMIGIITYVSVVERIKEIGIIRSLGGRKKDVSNLFKAETFIIGLLSGLIGVFATYGISAIVNAILYPLINVNIATLPIFDAVLMVILSVLLTSISGLMPAKSASKKDPVIALRTE